MKLLPATICCLLPLCACAVAADVSYFHEFAAAWGNSYDSELLLQSDIILTPEEALHADSDRFVSSDGTRRLELSSESTFAQVAALYVAGNCSVSGVTISQSCRDASMFYATGDMVFRNVTVEPSAGTVGITEGSMRISGSLTIALSAGMVDGIVLFAASGGFSLDAGADVTLELSGDFARPKKYTLFSGFEGTEPPPCTVAGVDESSYRLAVENRSVVLTVIPEPSALLSALPGMWLLLSRRRRKCAQHEERKERAWL